MNKKTYIALIKNALSYLNEEELHDLWQHSVRPTVLSVTFGTEKAEKLYKDITRLTRAN